MAPKSDLLQGYARPADSADPRRGSMHGWESRSRSSRFLRTSCRSIRDRSIRPCTGWSSRD